MSVGDRTCFAVRITILYNFSFFTCIAAWELYGRSRNSVSIRERLIKWLLYCIVLYYIVLYCVVLCFVVFCCVVLCYAVFCCVLLCCVVLCCVVLCCIVLCCVVLYCTFIFQSLSGLRETRQCLESIGSAWLNRFRKKNEREVIFSIFGRHNRLLRHETIESMWVRRWIFMTFVSIDDSSLRLEFRVSTRRS